MDGVNNREMLMYISNFIDEMDDYDPLELDDSTGCFNTKYHGNLCQAVVNPPINENRTESYPRTIIAYISTPDGVVLCDSNLDGYKLIECLGDSIENVYNNIKMAARYRDMYNKEREEH